MSFQSVIRIGFVVLLMLASGCAAAITAEEKAENILYRLHHPRPTTQEIER